MLELHMAQGMDLTWLKNVSGEKRSFPNYRVEWSRGIKEIIVEDKTKKILIFSKTTPGGDALWLPFTPGAINYTNSRGKDVISGPFSGCLMAAYEKKEGGGRRVCHVATTSDTMDCKEKWNEIKADCSFYAEFKPSDVYANLSKKQLGKLGSTILFGLITADNRCFSALVTSTGLAYKGHKIVRMQPTDQLGT